MRMTTTAFVSFVSLVAMCIFFALPTRAEDNGRPYQPEGFLPSDYPETAKQKLTKDYGYAWFNYNIPVLLRTFKGSLKYTKEQSRPLFTDEAWQQYIDFTEKLGIEEFLNQPGKTTNISSFFLTAPEMLTSGYIFDKNRRALGYAWVFKCVIQTSFFVNYDNKEVVSQLYIRVDTTPDASSMKISTFEVLTKDSIRSCNSGSCKHEKMLIDIQSLHRLEEIK